MKKVMLCILFGMALHIHASEPQVVNVNLHWGSSEQAEKPSLEIRKTAAAVGIGAATGGALFFGTVFSKNYEAFNNSLVYMSLVAVLLYSQRDVVKTYLGSAYTSIASWTSMISMVATGAASSMMDRKKTEPVENGDEGCEVGSHQMVSR